MSKQMRLAQVEDASAVQRIYEPIVTTTAISFELTPPSAEEIGQRIEQTLKAYPWLICEEQGRVLGYAYASEHNKRQAYQWSVDVSVYVDEQYRGQHLGKTLYTSLFALLRLQGFYSINAGIALPNAASVGLHEALGMRSVGIYHATGYKLGRWHDVGWWEGELQTHQAEPAPPLNLLNAQALPGWQAALESGLTHAH